MPYRYGDRADSSWYSQMDGTCTNNRLIILFYYLPIYLSNYLTIYLSIYLSDKFPAVNLFILISLSIYLPMYSSPYLSTYLCIHLPTHLFINLLFYSNSSICPYDHLFSTNLSLIFYVPHSIWIDLSIYLPVRTSLHTGWNEEPMIWITGWTILILQSIKPMNKKMLCWKIFLTIRHCKKLLQS